MPNQSTPALPNTWTIQSGISMSGISFHQHSRSSIYQSCTPCNSYGCNREKWKPSFDFGVDVTSSFHLGKLVHAQLYSRPLHSVFFQNRVFISPSCYSTISSFPALRFSLLVRDARVIAPAIVYFSTSIFLRLKKRNLPRHSFRCAYYFTHISLVTKTERKNAFNSFHFRPFCFTTVSEYVSSPFQNCALRCRPKRMRQKTSANCLSCICTRLS